MERLLKNGNKRCDHQATRETVFYLALKIGYINKTHTHTGSGAENSLFQYWLTIKKPFSPSYLEEKTIYWSLSAWWVYCLVSRAVSQLIMYGGRELPIEKSALWRNFFYFLFLSVIVFQFLFKRKVKVKSIEIKIKWNESKVKWCKIKIKIKESFDPAEGCHYQHALRKSR